MILDMLAQAALTDPVAATEAYMSTLSAEATARSDAYFVGGYWLILWGLLIGLAIAWLLLSGQRSAKIKNWLSSKLPKWLVTPFYVVAYSLITTIITFPFIVYTDFFRERSYDLMNQNLGGWFGEQMIGLGIGTITDALALWLIYVLIRRLGPAWRWWGAGASIAMVSFFALIAPVFISPLFNDYTPMEDGPLRTEILAMAEANGVPAENVYVFNISKQTDRVTANVSGFLGTTRISLSDTLLQQSSTSGVKAVMGHEIGHYALGHIYEMLIYFGLVILFGFIFTHWLYGVVQRRYGTRWNIGPIGDIAGLPLFIAAFSIFGFLATPVFNRIIYSNEVEADIYGLNAAGQPDGFAETALLLAKYRKMKAGPIEEFVFYDHPSGYHRILMSMRWKAAHEVIDNVEAERTVPSVQEAP